MDEQGNDQRGDAGHDAVSVRVEQGALAGRRVDGIVRFDAVPYAAAPLGPLRWRAPQPAPPWPGERNARGAHEACEDCLRLSIRTPGCDAARRPVLVWIGSGTGCNSGAGAADADGERLAREGDAVVVAVDHRRGALGYLHLPELPAANLGLLDIEAALQWVQRHAAAFGGDASRITVAGQSGSALAIALLLARWPRGAVPFARAILQSAPLGLALPDRALVAEIGRRFVQHAGPLPSTGADRLAALQRLPLARLAQAQREVAAWLDEQHAPPGEPAPGFGPWPDGQVLPEAASIESALDAAAGAVDVLIGANRDEMSAFASTERLQADWDRAGLSEAVLDAQRGASQAERFRSYLGERLFRRPVARWAEQAAAAGRRAFAYSFDWAPPGSPLGATHGIELPFVFGDGLPFDGGPVPAGVTRRELDRLSAQVRRAWLGFVRHGRPEGPGLPPWPSVTPMQRSVLHFDRVCTLGTVVVT